MSNINNDQLLIKEQEIKETIDLFYKEREEMSIAKDKLTTLAQTVKIIGETKEVAEALLLWTKNKESVEKTLGELLQKLKGQIVDFVPQLSEVKSLILFEKLIPGYIRDGSRFTEVPLEADKFERVSSILRVFFSESDKKTGDVLLAASAQIVVQDESGRSDCANILTIEITRTGEILYYRFEGEHYGNCRITKEQFEQQCS